MQGGAAALAAGSDSGWGLPIGTLVLGLRHIGLCGFEAGECMAVERELTAWQKAGGLSQKENALRCGRQPPAWRGAVMQRCRLERWCVTPAGRRKPPQVLPQPCRAPPLRRRLRATLQRLQRITEAYVAVLMEAYTDRAQKLGNALGLDPYLITGGLAARWACWACFGHVA